jgi:hypothetical protein
MHHTSHASVLGAVALIVLLAIVAAFLAGGLGWRRLRWAVLAGAIGGGVFQLGHFGEHVALTVSVVVGSRARGLSTLFGTLDPGPGLWTYRIWWHLTVNAIATALLATAVIRWRRGSAPVMTTASRAFARP